MDLLRITGGRTLRGSVRVAGAKNAALPCLAASLLTEEPLVLSNLPDVWDVDSMIRLVQTLGVSLDERGPRQAALRARRRTTRAARVPEGYLRAVPGGGLSEDECRRIERAVGELAEAQRAVVILRFWGGLTFPQMAEALRTPARTLESRWRVAMERLRKKLGKKNDE